MNGYNPYHEQQDIPAPYYGLLEGQVVPLTEANKRLFDERGYKTFHSKPEAEEEAEREIGRLAQINPLMAMQVSQARRVKNAAFLRGL